MPTNLKKQGLLPLTFKNPSDYDKVVDYASVQTVGLESLKPNSLVKLLFKFKNGRSVTIDALHTMSIDQIEWLKAGSALNMIANK